MKKLIVIFAMVLMSQMVKGQIHFSDTLWTEDKMSPGTFITNLILDTSKEYALGVNGINSIIVINGEEKKNITFNKFHYLDTTGEYVFDRKIYYLFNAVCINQEETLNFLNKNYKNKGNDVWIEKIGKETYKLEVRFYEGNMRILLAQEK